MTGRLKDKIAVITGAASGIGAGAARKFVEEGASVVVADRDADRGAALAKELGDAVRFIRTDVTSEDDVAAAVACAISSFGRLDCMVNNAGIVGAIGSIAETPADAWDKTISVHLTGTFYGMKHAARAMIPQRSGAILSIASTAGTMGGLGPHAYTAAKHGVVGLTKSAASELAQYGIRVNCVAPGNTVTAMTAHVVTGDRDNEADTDKAIAATSPLGIAGTPEDQAYALVYLASEEARYVTGHTLLVDAGQTTAGGMPKFHTDHASLLDSSR